MSRCIAFDGRTMQDHFPGIARYDYNLITTLVAAAPDDEFVVLGPPARNNTRFDLAGWRLRPNLTMVEVPASLFSLSSQWRVPQALRRAQADLYHSPYYLMPYITPCPSIVTVHDLIPVLYPQYFTLFQRIVFSLAMRLAVGRARFVMADSEATARDLRTRLHVQGDRIIVAPLGVDPAMEPAAPAVISAMRARFGLPEDYVLFVGSNKPHKNLVRLVEAYGRIAGRVVAPLVIAGHWDPDHPEAKARAEQLNVGAKVRWLGQIPAADLPALYSGATLFAFPSEYEGFGLPVLEAMACGAPVICASASSLPEVAGAAAVLLDPRHVEGWSHAIERLLADPEHRAQLRDAGLRRAALFSWSETARQTLAVYRRVIG